MSNRNDVNDAFTEMLKILNPNIYAVLVDVYGVEWWNCGVIKAFESTSYGNQFQRDLKKLSTYSDSKKKYRVWISLLFIGF